MAELKTATPKALHGSTAPALPGPAAKGAASPDDKPSNSGAKIMLLVMFLFAAVLGVAAGFIQIRNKRELSTLVPNGWFAPNAEEPIGLDEGIAPEDLTLWEKVKMAQEMRPKVNAFIRLEKTGALNDPNQNKSKMLGVANELAEKLGIVTAGNLKMMSPVAKEVGSASKTVRETYWEMQFKIEFAQLSRKQLVDFVLALEDENRFLKVRELEIERKDDATGQDAWKASMLAVWYERKAKAPAR